MPGAPVDQVALTAWWYESSRETLNATVPAASPALPAAIDIAGRVGVPVCVSEGSPSAAPPVVAITCTEYVVPPSRAGIV